MVGALTSPEKKRLGLLHSGALNRGRMGFTGLQRRSYSQTKQLICQGDPQCPPPLLWFVHGSIYLQSRRVLKMRVSETRSPAWDQAITHLTTVLSLLCVDFQCKSNRSKQSSLHFIDIRECKDRILYGGRKTDHPVPLMSQPGDRRWTSIRSDPGSYSAHVVCQPKNCQLHS